MLVAFGSTRNRDYTLGEITGYVLNHIFSTAHRAMRSSNSESASENSFDKDAILVNVIQRVEYTDDGAIDFVAIDSSHAAQTDRRVTVRCAEVLSNSTLYMDEIIFGSSRLSSDKCGGSGEDENESEQEEMRPE